MSEDLDQRASVLFVHHRSELGGAPSSLSYLIRELDRDAFDPHVYCPPGAAADLFRSAGATVHTGAVASFTHIWASVYRGRRWLLFARELAWLPSHVRGLRRTLRRNRFDLVHLNDSPLIPAAMLATRARLPVVWHLRSALPDGGLDRRSRFIRRAIQRHAAASIAINEDIATVFDVGQCDVVPNSIDLDRFSPGDAERAKQELGLPTELPVVSFFGFLYPSKGFQEFIHSARRLRDRGVDATFLIVGGGVRSSEFFGTLVGRSLKLIDLARDYEVEARRLVSELGLDDAVRFVPFTKETGTLYRASAVVVAPSRGLELGRPVIEAAASGVPVVASGSRTGGGVVEPGVTGLLVGSADPQHLADAIADLLGDAERRQELGRAARRHAEVNFDPALNARRVEAVYLRVRRASQRTPVLFIERSVEAGVSASLAETLRSFDGRFEPHLLVRAAPGLSGLLRLDRSLRRHRIAVVHAAEALSPPEAWLVRRRGARFVHQVAAPSRPSSVEGETVTVGVDLARFQPTDSEIARRRLGLDVASFTVGFTAVPGEAALRDFLRAARLFTRAGGEARFAVRLLGGSRNGSRQELERLVGGLGLADRVQVLDPACDSADFYNAVDVVVFPGRGEFPARLVAEASACGRAIVAADLPGGSGVVVPGLTAILTPPRSPAVLAAAVRCLADDPELRARLGVAARRHAQENLDGASNGASLERLYERVLERAG